MSNGKLRLIRACAAGCSTGSGVGPRRNNGVRLSESHHVRPCFQLLRRRVSCLTGADVTGTEPHRSLTLCEPTTLRACTLTPTVEVSDRQSFSSVLQYKSVCTISCLPPTSLSEVGDHDPGFGHPGKPAITTRSSKARSLPRFLTMVLLVQFLPA